MMVKFLREYKGAKKFPAKDEQFSLLLQSTTSSILPAYCESSLGIARDMEPLLTLFQVERPLVVFLCEQLKYLIFTILGQFLKHDVLKKISSAFQLINLDLKCEQNLLLIESIDADFGAKHVLSKLKTTEKSIQNYAVLQNHFSSNLWKSWWKNVL